MHINFERTGGFAGMRLAAAIDTATLPADQAGALHDLVDAAHFFELPSQMPPQTNVADQFHYHVTIEAAGQSHTVDVGDSSAPPALQALLQQLMLLARSARST